MLKAGLCKLFAWLETQKAEVIKGTGNVQIEKNICIWKIQLGKKCFLSYLKSSFNNSAVYRPAEFVSHHRRENKVFFFQKCNVTLELETG